MAQASMVGYLQSQLPVDTACYACVINKTIIGSPRSTTVPLIAEMLSNAIVTIISSLPATHDPESQVGFILTGLIGLLAVA